MDHLVIYHTLDGSAPRFDDIPARVLRLSETLADSESWTRAHIWRNEFDGVVTWDANFTIGQCGVGGFTYDAEGRTIGAYVVNGVYTTLVTEKYARATIRAHSRNVLAH